MGKTDFLSEPIEMMPRTDTPRKILISGIINFHLYKVPDMFAKERWSEVTSKSVEVETGANMKGIS